MSRFLRLAVTETLAGKADRLKEYVYGLEVFDRPASFDPSSDPIVRVEARRLRSKLQHYYANEGRHDELVIELPKGHYVPVFRHRGAIETAHPQPSAPHTIAVLPFVNLTSTEEAGYFTDGLTWELIHRLTRIEGLAVVAWSSAAQVRGEGLDIVDIAAKLKVRTVLNGSIRKSGNRVRIMAQLIDGATGRYLWSETFDRQVDDIFAIQEEIAGAIVATLKIRLEVTPAQPPHVRKYNLEAYQLYLEGRVHWNQRTEIRIRQALANFREAARIDPQFALAYAGTADALSVLADYGLAAPTEVMPAAKAAALRALEIDPSLGEAYSSLALMNGLYEWNWTESEANFRRALGLNPGYATAHYWFGCDCLAMIGRFDEAMEEVEIARQLDPLSSIAREICGYVLLLTRRYEEAAEHYRRIFAEDPTFYKAYTSLGRVLIHLGKYEEALANLERGHSLVGDLPSILGAMGQAYALSGRRADACRMIARLEAIASERYVSSTPFAIVYAGLGEHGRALDYLEEGAAGRDLPVSGIGFHPAYDALRDEPRFRALLRRMSLPDRVPGEF
jgi:serine/threonine-protein kinase